jgi:phosphoribosyl-dephospho-CoA transferase
MYARHSLAWLTDNGWYQAQDGAPANCREAVMMWRQEGWPAVVRRADVDAAQRQVCIGIALPPDRANGNKRRIPLTVSMSGIRKIMGPMQIQAVMHSLPEAWRACLASLAAEVDARGLAFNVYGSVAWQTLTGQRYLTPASDIDLLFYPASLEQLSAGLELLSCYAARLPLDGEIVFPSGQAVAWKEWASAVRTQGNTRVLVKGSRTVNLVGMTALLDTLESHRCTS